MTDLVMVALGDRCLALTRDQFHEALARGRELVAPSAPAPAPKDAAGSRLLTAEQMQEHTGVPAAWFLEQARRGEIPHVRLGKYRRFVLGEVVEHSRFREVLVNDRSGYLPNH